MSVPTAALVWLKQVTGSAYLLLLECPHDPAFYYNPENMPPRLTGAKTCARALALVALFMFAAVQGLEASHSHLEQDAADNCLLCKNSTDTVAGISNPADTLPQAYIAPATLSPRVAPAPPHTRFFARGPPSTPE